MTTVTMMMMMMTKTTTTVNGARGEASDFAPEFAPPPCAAAFPAPPASAAAARGMTPCRIHISAALLLTWRATAAARPCALLLPARCRSRSAALREPPKFASAPPSSSKWRNVRRAGKGFNLPPRVLVERRAIARARARARAARGARGYIRHAQNAHGPRAHVSSPLAPLDREHGDARLRALPRSSSPRCGPNGLPRAVGGRCAILRRKPPALATRRLAGPCIGSARGCVLLARGGGRTRRRGIPLRGPACGWPTHSPLCGGWRICAPRARLHAAVGRLGFSSPFFFQRARELGVSGCVCGGASSGRARVSGRA